MSIYMNTNEYINEINSQLDTCNLSQKYSGIQDYLNSQLALLNNLIENITKDNFWQTLPKIVGIDSKVSLVIELIRFDELSYRDIVGMAEKEYLSYYKELCGYSLNTDPKPSLLFNVT